MSKVFKHLFLKQQSMNKTTIKSISNLFIISCISFSYAALYFSEVPKSELLLGSKYIKAPSSVWTLQPL